MHSRYTVTSLPYSYTHVQNATVTVAVIEELQQHAVEAGTVGAEAVGVGVGAHLQQGHSSGHMTCSQGSQVASRLPAQQVVRSSGLVANPAHHATSASSMYCVRKRVPGDYVPPKPTWQSKAGGVYVPIKQLDD
eukprot:11750-Heterococcus_DN1.PRE.4